MKKVIYLLVFVAAIFTGCNPLDDINNEIDALPEAPNVGDFEYTLLEADYETLNVDPLGFESVEAAKLALPELLTSLYPLYGEGSSAIVNFDLFAGNPEEVSLYTNASVYSLNSNDYPTAASNAFFPNEDAFASLEDVLTANIMTPEAGDVVRVDYNKFLQEPIAGFTAITEYSFDNSLSGWSIEDQFGNEGWTAEGEYVQASGFNGGAQINDDWLVSPEIDLTEETGLSFQINQAIRFASDLSLLKILVKTDWDETTFNALQWDEITLATSPAGDSDTMVLSEDYDFSAYEGETIHIALKYESTASEAARWRVDNLAIRTAGFEGDTETRSAFYIYSDSGDWELVEGVNYLTSLDYDLMGENSGQPGQFNNFSSTVATEDYLPQFLDIKYPFAQEEDELILIYKYYGGSSVGTIIRGNQYIFTDGEWTATKSSLKFGYKNGEWIPDNTIRINLGAAEFAYIGSQYATTSGFESPVASLIQYSNFDRRPSEPAYWSEEMLFTVFVDLIDNFLGPDAEEGQKYVLSFAIYDGSPGVEEKSFIKTDGEWVINLEE